MSSTTREKAATMVCEQEPPAVEQAPETAQSMQCLYGNDFLRSAMPEAPEFRLGGGWFDEIVNDLGALDADVEQAEGPVDEGPVAAKRRQAELMGTEVISRGAGRGERHRAWVGIDQLAGPEDEMRVRALNLGGEVHFAGGGVKGFRGAEVHATAAGVSTDPSERERSGPWGGFRVGDVGATGVVGDNGCDELGYRADVMSGEIGARRVNANFKADRGVRIGLSAGVPNFAVRRYSQDLDNDGQIERGFGVNFPLGPVGVSADLVSETYLGDGIIRGMDGLALGRGFPPIAGLADEAIGAYAGPENAPSAVLDAAILAALGEAK